MSFSEREPSFESYIPQPATAETDAPVEKTPRKELVFNVGGIVISGYPGTGKSRVIDGLVKRLGISENRKFKMGNLMRQAAYEATGEHVLDYYNRSVEADIALDNMQRDMLQYATPSNPFILESKLGGYLAHELREKAKAANQPPPPVVTILLTGDEGTLLQRVYKRERKNHPGLIKEKSDEKTKNRQKLDLEQWGLANPDLVGIDPLSPASAHLYDIVVDTTNLTAKEVEEEIYRKLKEMRAIEVQRRRQCSSGVIFEKP